MNIGKLYEMQKELDERIIREKGLEGQDLLPNTVLALQVEIGKLANEWRGFKHWSSDQEPRTAVEYECGYCDGSGMTVTEKDCVVCDGKGYILENRVLEEYVDCLHFFLNIARQLDLLEDDLYLPEPARDEELKGETTVVFTELLYLVARIGAEYYAPKPALTRKQRFRVALYLFFALGEQRLGFTWDQIAEAYIKKNRINHERQANGY
jgi:dimeric dUTPase (all-alpha-NTP-PPase superfamily)